MQTLFGMRHRALSELFRPLGLTEDTSSLLKILPAVYVAWADGVIEEPERARLLELARRYHGMTDDAVGVLEHWLLWRPSHEYFYTAFDLLHDLATAPAILEFDVSEFPMIMAQAEAIARTRSVGMDRASWVDLREERALAELSWRLRTDYGVPWSELVRELDSSVAHTPATPP